MHSVVNLPCETFSRLKTMSRHSIGWVSLMQLEELALELDRDLLRDRRQVAQVGDEGGLGRLEGRRVHAGDLGDAVADGGAVEALGGVELVAVLHGVGDALEDLGQVRLGVLVRRGGGKVLGQGDAPAGRAGAR